MAVNSDQIRNVAFVAHSGAGKTSLAEAMLFKAGIITRIGRVEDGNTAMDYEPEELKRTSSISTGIHQFPWKKNTVTILDTPGDQNFFTDTKNCMQAADSALFVIDALDGVRVQTEQGWEFAEDFNLPVMLCINKLDKERADYEQAFEDVKNSLPGPKPILLQLPIGAEAEFKGVVDLISGKAFVYDGGNVSSTDVPDDMQAAVESEMEALIENIAEADDELIERYLEGETITSEELRAALCKGINERIFAPVLFGSATANIGVDNLMDFLATIAPTPIERGAKTGTDLAGKEAITRSPEAQAPFSAFVFKTVADPYSGRLSIFRVVSGTLGSDGNFYNATKESKERFNQLLTIAGKEQKPVEGAGPGAIVAVAKLKDTTTGDTLCADTDKVRYTFADPLPALISFALESKSKGDEDKIYISLNKLIEEDSGLKLERNSETNEILLSGRGQVHIEATIEKMKRKFGVDVHLNIPKVPYRETIKKKVRVQGKHKKQTGGHGQYGDCWIQMEPLPRGGGFEFVDAIVGGVIPKTYIPAVEKGIVESAHKGVIAGFPTVDFKVTLDDGSFHAVDSSEMAFKVAGSLAFKKAVADANPVLLEPIMEVTVTTPDEYMGDIMGDLNGRRGRVLGMESAGKYQQIKAQVPLAEFQTYAPDLRSMTGGRGIYSMGFSHYDEVPSQIAEKVIEELKMNQE
ncbi:MAG: elongation factor G [Desulfobacterales bacterium]|nr:elongation factor G [Desulfobacterales bacterium]